MEMTKKWTGLLMFVAVCFENGTFSGFQSQTPTEETELLSENLFYPERASARE